MSDSDKVLRKLGKPPNQPASKPAGVKVPTLAQMIESILSAEELPGRLPVGEVQRQMRRHECRCGFHAASSVERGHVVLCPNCHIVVRGEI